MVSMRCPAIAAFAVAPTVFAAGCTNGPDTNRREGTETSSTELPMLIDSYALQQTIVDSDMSTETLENMDGVGVRGLGLLAGGLRKPTSVKHPFLRLSA
jgi:hypothetical protein